MHYKGICGCWSSKYHYGYINELVSVIYMYYTLYPYVYNQIFTEIFQNRNVFRKFLLSSQHFEQNIMTQFCALKRKFRQC